MLFWALSQRAVTCCGQPPYPATFVITGGPGKLFVQGKDGAGYVFVGQAGEVHVGVAWGQGQDLARRGVSQFGHEIAKLYNYDLMLQRLDSGLAKVVQS